MATKKHQHMILLNDQQQEWLNALLGKGYDKQELFRGNLRDIYLKEFPPYRRSMATGEKKKKGDDRIPAPERWSDREYCEKILDGEVIDGAIGTYEGLVCHIEYGGFTKEIKLDEVKNYKTKEEV